MVERLQLSLDDTKLVLICTRFLLSSALAGFHPEEKIGMEGRREEVPSDYFQRFVTPSLEDECG